MIHIAKSDPRSGSIEDMEIIFFTKNMFFFTFKENPKVIPRIRIFRDIGFSKGSDTQNHSYHNENLFKSIDMMWVLFDENHF